MSGLFDSIPLRDILNGTAKPTEDLVPVELNALEPLNHGEQTVLAIAEQIKYNTGKLPAPRTFPKNVGLSTEQLEEIYEKPAFKQALKSKGLVTDSHIPGYLTTKQVQTANQVLTRQDKKSFRQKLRECEVTVNQWNGWLTDPVFVDYLRKRAGTEFNSANHTFFNTIIEAMEEGDLNATKMYGEIMGLYQNKVTVDININVVLSQFVEIIMPFIPEHRLEEAADAIEQFHAIYTAKPKNIIEATATATAMPIAI